MIPLLIALGVIALTFFTARFIGVGMGTAGGEKCK
jgi:hypothetical protein